MAKLVDGKVLRREDGKVLKPEGWQPRSWRNSSLTTRERVHMVS